MSAFTLSGEIGIDIEQIREDVDIASISKRFFALEEIEALRSLTPELRRETFFRCWTRKEAYLKARGEGLSIPLNQFAVSIQPGEPTAILTSRLDPEEANRWCLKDLHCAEGYAAMVAICGHDWALRCWDWTPDALTPHTAV